MASSFISLLYFSVCAPVNRAAAGDVTRREGLPWVLLPGRPGEGGAVVVWLPPCTLWQLWENWVHGEPSHGRRVCAQVCVWTVYKIIPALLSEFGGKLCFWDAPWDQSLSFPSYIYARAVNLVDTSDSVSHCTHIWF